MHHYMFWRMLNGHFLGGLLALIVVVGIVLLIVYLASRKNKTPAKAATATAASAGGAVHATHERILALLNEQKASGAMGATEFEERKLILEGGKGDNYANAELVALKERYARAELTTAAYLEERNRLLNIG